MRKISLLMGLGGLALCGLSHAQDSSQTNNQKMITTASGLQYFITKSGNGAKPNFGDKVSVHYAGRLEDRTEFDNSYKRGQPISFILGKGMVIKGWDEGISLLHAGDKATFYIPPQLGYGERGAPPVIPPQATLIFDVELVNVKERIIPKPYDVVGKDTIKTASGLKYILLQNGSGEFPQVGKKVFVHYTGFLQNGTIFDSSVERDEPFTFTLGTGQVIKGWDEGVALLKVGGKARLIIPFQLAYGEKGFPNLIPPKSTLIFDVELMEIR